MRGKMVLLAGILVLCLGLVGTPASWANNLTFQNVTFDMSINGSGNLVLNITNALNANGDWTGIDQLGAFAINTFGSATGLTATDNTGQPITWTTVPGGLNASGCNPGEANWVCFSASPFLNLTNDFTITIARTSGSFSLDPAPHLKVWFQGADQGGGHGNLLSQAVPVPGTFLMFGLGMMGLVGWHYRSRYQVSSMNLVA